MVDLYLSLPAQHNMIKVSCKICRWYSETFPQFFKDMNSTKGTARNYKQVNKLKRNKHSLEEFENMKEAFVKHFNRAHVKPTVITDA